MHIHVDIELPALPKRRTRRIALALVLALAVAVPGLALASHQFGDVPNANPFHGDISAIANAGVTSGCGGGNYCPDRNVTRGEMAAFMNRLGALSSNKTPVVNADKVDGFQGNDLALGTATIPSGMTVTGFAQYDSAIVVDNQGASITVRLPGRAPVALTYLNVNFASGAAASDDDPTCTGTYGVPTAPAGKVCLYLMGAGHVDTANGYGTYSPYADRYFTVYFAANGTAGQDMYIYFAWAYTAP